MFPRPARLAWLALLPLSWQARAQDSFTGVSRIVAVGDVHGDYAQFTTVLRQASLIDERERWTGGRTHLVQTGDVLDRGPDSRKVMELLMALAPQAQRAGGRVHALIGNHETMNMLGDLRYVAPGEYEAFRGPTSIQLQERAFAALADSARRTDPAYRAQWMREHPPGWVEHRLAFEGNGRYASWIRRNNAVVKIDDWLFLHGGIGPKYATWSLRALNDSVRAVLRPDARPVDGNIAEDPEGPLWYRGLSQGEEEPLTPHVQQLLTHFGVRHVVVGHTVTPGAILSRHDGAVVTIDVGLAAAYGGPPAALVIEGSRVMALHRGTLLDLPMGDDPLPYLRKAAVLDPAPSRLLPFIERLAAARTP